MDIALVGIGKIAIDQHVPALAASSDWNLTATVSRSGSVDGIMSYPNIEAMLAQRPEIGVVSLCVPPVPRFDIAATALKAGRHVMLEKPPGATLSECHALIELAKQNNVSLYASWHSREAAMVAPAKAWLADKTLRRLAVKWKEDVRHWHPGQDWIFEPGGLGVFDPGINALSIVTAILPDPIHLTSATLHIPSNRQAPIAADLTFYHPKGAVVTAELDSLHEGVQSWVIEIETEQGELVLTDGGAKMFINGVETGGDVTSTLLGEYPRLYANWAKIIADNAIDMDISPMRHVADAFTLGRRETVAAFEF